MWHQREKTPLFNIGWIISSLFLSACGGSQERLAPDETYTVYDGEEVIVLDSQIKSCSHVGFSQLVVVQGCHAAINAETRFESYYDIAGFDPEWGNSYELLVEYWKTPHEIADAPAIMVKLKEIIRVQEDPAATRYEYAEADIRFTFDNNQRFLNHDWTCGLDEGCDWILSSADPVDLTFEKQSDGAMLLVDAVVAASQVETF